MLASASTPGLTTDRGSPPERILLVDDDELELALMADRIASAGFDVGVAQNGAEALNLLAQQWYPVLITDWQMPVMDGIQLTQAVRERGTPDVHIMMLTMREDRLDYERGYVSGVDDYLTKKLPDVELLARIRGAFRMLSLRRSVHEAQDALAHESGIDPDSGAWNTAMLEATLTREIRRAQRYGRKLSLLTFGVKSKEPSRSTLSPPLLHKLVGVATEILRSCADRIGRLQALEGVLFAVVLPETGLLEVRLIAERLGALLGKLERAEGVALHFTCGLTALEDDTDRTAASVNSLIDAAERCRRLAGEF